MAIDPAPPRSRFWDYIVSKRRDAGNAEQEPLIPEFQDVPKPPVGWKILAQPNRDADFYRVPDPDFFEPPDDCDR